MKIVSVIIFLGITVFGRSMTAEELLRKMKVEYASVQSMEYNSVYRLYKGYTASKVHSSYEGYIYRNGKEVYQKIDQTEFIYAQDFFLKINHKEKAILVDRAQKYVNMEMDLDQALQNCKEKTVEDKGTYYLLKLTYLSFAQSPFSSVIMKIQKKGYLLLQLDLFYRAAQNFSEDINVKESVSPRLQIEFSNMNLKPKKITEYFDLSNYLAKKNNKLITVGSLAGYEIIDNRIK